RGVGWAPWHYLLGVVGAALLGAEDRNERKWVPQVRADRQLALERSQRLAHMVGRNWFFVSLAAEARHGGGELRAWLNEAEAAAHGRDRLPVRLFGTRLPRPGCRARVAGVRGRGGGGGGLLWGLSAAAGEPPPRGAGKLEDWGGRGGAKAGGKRFAPPLLFCFLAPRREQAARRELAACRDVL